VSSGVSSVNDDRVVASIDGTTENVTKVWMRAALAALICAACHREAAAPPPVDQIAACASAGTLAQLKAALLQVANSDAAGAHGRRYLERVGQAQVTLSDVALGSYDPSSGEAHCAAVAHLVSPLTADAALAAERISYTTRPGPDGRASLSDLQGPGGGDYDQFAKLLQPKIKVPEPKPATAPAVAPLSDADAVDTNTAGDASSHPTTTLSYETQRLVDQAGDTRAVENTETTTETATPNTIPNGGL
jgi:hypothetical protein